MAPYHPPSAHYAHLKVDLYDDDMLDSFMGKHGRRFYDLTRILNVYYIWWNKASKIIEVWGPYESFRDNKPIDFIHDSLDHHVEHHYFSKSVSTDFIGRELCGVV